MKEQDCLITINVKMIFMTYNNLKILLIVMSEKFRVVSVFLVFSSNCLATTLNIIIVIIMQFSSLLVATEILMNRLLLTYCC